MTPVQTYLSDLPAETKALFIPIFESVDRFYTVVYLIARNEHVTDMEKPDRYEERMRMIRSIRMKIELLLTSWQLNGQEIVADIASDYFEDYVSYKEPEIEMTNEKFVEIIHRIAAIPL